MAWIKLRTNLWDDPRVAGLCDATDASEAAVIGGLYWLWAMADSHTTDGTLLGLTLKTIDRKTALPGFAQALVDIGWLAEVDGGVAILGFDEHNGESAKKRAQGAKRKAKCVAGNAQTNKTSESGNANGVTDSEIGNAAGVTGALPKEDKRKSKDTHSLARDDSAPDSAGADVPHQIDLNWQPCEAVLAPYAKLAGIPLARFNSEACAGFILHHEAKRSVMTDAEWHSALVRWVKRDQASAAVVPLRGRASSAAADWAEEGVML